MGQGLTTKELDALRLDRHGSRVADRDGLYVRLFDTGARSFQLRVVIDGARPWITLGSYPKVSLADARARGAKVKELVSRGVSLDRVRVALGIARTAADIEATLPADAMTSRKGSRPAPDSGHERNAASQVGTAGSSPDRLETTSLSPVDPLKANGAQFANPRARVGDQVRSRHERTSTPRSVVVPGPVLPVPLSDLIWRGGAGGRVWARLSTSEVVSSPCPVAGLGDGAEALRTPLAGLSSRSTFHEATVLWFEWKRPTLSNLKAADQNWNTMNTYVLPLLGHLTLTEVRRSHVLGVLTPLWRSTHETARRVHGRIREVLEMAVAEELIPANVASFDPRVSLGRRRRRTEHHGSLGVDEASACWEWLCKTPCDEATRGLAQLLFLTAKRTGEGRFARWSDFDLGNHTWTSLDAAVEDLIPGGPTPLVVWTTTAERMKMRVEHRVPLSRQAIQVLLNLRSLATKQLGSEDFVFARRTKSGTLSENTVLKHLKTFDAGITGHGLRATFKTWATSTKQDWTLVEFSLAHVPEKLEQAYQRSDLLMERRSLMDDWADRVTGAAVVPFAGDKRRADVPVAVGQNSQLEIVSHAEEGRVGLTLATRSDDVEEDETLHPVFLSRRTWPPLPFATE